MWNVATDPTGKYIFPLDFTLNTTTPGQVFSYGATPSTGVIGSPIGSAVSTGFNSQGMAVDPTGVFLAVDNLDSDTISLFKIAADGTLSPSSTPTVPTGTGPQFVVFYTAASPAE